MSMFLLNVLLAIAWSALNGRFEPVDLLFGYLLGFGMLWVAFRSLKPNRYFTQIPKIIDFFFFFLWELILSNFRLAGTILSRNMKIHPGVVSVPLDLKSQAGVVLLANLLTLTPGTLTLDISTDQKMLYIHTLWLDDPAKFRTDIKQGYERRVKEIFEG